MRVRTTQIIDYWAGIPICVVLTLWHWFASVLKALFGRVPAATVPKRILFLELSEMGSAIIAHSALRQAELRYPGSELFFMVFSKNKESVSLLGVIPEKNLILIDESNFLSLVWSTLHALLRVRALKIDTVIDLELFSRFTSILSFLSGSERRIGFDNYTAEGLFRGRFLTHRVFYNPHQHMELNFLALVCAAGSDPKDIPLLKMDLNPLRVPLPRYRATDSEHQELWRLLQSINPRVKPGDRILVVNPDPGDALPIRGWPMERYVSALQQLMAINEGLFCAVIGLKRSKPYADAILAGLPLERCLDLTGKTKVLREVVALFTQAELLITNDSGPAHFAALTDIKSIALFGPETPALYGAMGENKLNIWANYSCSPCLSAHNHRHTLCKDNKCLQAIGEERVVEAAQAFLNSRNDSSEKKSVGNHF
jgi:ADP-heptose:LPS heptosyltransferase